MKSLPCIINFMHTFLCAARLIFDNTTEECVTSNIIFHLFKFIWFPLRKIEYMNSLSFSQISTSSLDPHHHQPPCQPLSISNFTSCNANHCPYSILHHFWPCRIEYTFFIMTLRATPTPVPTSLHFQFYQLQCQPLSICDITWFLTM